jgi:EAL domain-containing protein (putative c-di-GMP-specific phosphodiesterase class I)
MALERFAPLCTASPELILFVNFHISAVDTDAEEPDNLPDLVQQLHLDPRNIAIETLESEFADVTQLRKAVEYYNKGGFLVVLDDVGTGYSNLDRILDVKPDILKADRSLVQGIHADRYKQNVFKALVNLSERIGGWIVTEGVETQAEAIVALDLGADMLQGFYFARLRRIEHAADLPGSVDRMQETAGSFKRYTLDRFKATQRKQVQRRTITQTIAAHLQDCAAHHFEHKLRELLDQYAEIESAAVLDASGIQISETVRNQQHEHVQKTIIFRLPVKGTDHSLKEYYYLLMETPTDVFETQPYVPLPSGELCITISRVFKDAAQHTRILCLHVHALSELAGWRIGCGENYIPDVLCVTTRPIALVRI